MLLLSIHIRLEIFLSASLQLKLKATQLLKSAKLASLINAIESGWRYLQTRVFVNCWATSSFTAVDVDVAISVGSHSSSLYCMQCSL